MIAVHVMSRDGETVEMPLPHQIGVFHDYEERRTKDVLDLPPFYDPMGECFGIKLLTTKYRLIVCLSAHYVFPTRRI